MVWCCQLLFKKKIKKKLMELGQGSSGDNGVKNKNVGTSDDEEVDPIVDKSRDDATAARRLAYIVEFVTNAKEIVPFIRDLVKKLAHRGVSLTNIYDGGGEVWLFAKLRHDTCVGCDIIFETRHCDGKSLMAYTHCNMQTLQSIMEKMRAESESLTQTTWPDDPCKSFSVIVKERKSDRFQGAPMESSVSHKTKELPKMAPLPDPLFLDFDMIHDTWFIEVTQKTARHNINKAANWFSYNKSLIHSIFHRRALHIDDSGRIQVRNETEEHNCGVFEVSEDQLVLKMVLGAAYSKQIHAAMLKVITCDYPDVASAVSIKLRASSNKI